MSGVPNEAAETSGADVVVEAVIEDLEVKRALFARLEPALSPGAVLATNTSALSVTDLASGLARPERLCGWHFFNPVPAMKIVEVVPGERTDAAVVERLTRLTRDFGHTPVVVRDSPGFLVNHAGRAYATEALRLLDEGVASPADLDRILRDGGGFRMGPFELFDLTGLDVSQPVMESVYAGFFHDPRLRPSPTGRRRLAGGRLGRKTGGGFYDYADGAATGTPEAQPPSYDGTPVWLGAADDRLAELLRGAGVLVTEGLAPPAVALSATGVPVTRINDSAAFVAQRVVACVVNLGSEIVQLGLASPADIDTAVRLGLAYPAGPLAWGDVIGPANVLQVLEGLVSSYGDPRYRPSPWLRRRAQLGLSLLVEETR